MKTDFSNHNITKRRCAPCFIVVHYTACLCSAERVCTAMSKNKVSTHYIVDESGVLHTVDESKYYAWHCATSNRRVYCAATNGNSIGVDLCEKKISTASKSVGDNDWYFAESTLEHAAELIAGLMNKYRIPLEHVVRHYDVTKKMCPRPFCGDDINTVTKCTGDENWARFKALILSKA